MPTKSALSAKDREFFQWVAAAAFTNPFSPQRLEFDHKIAGATFKDETERAEFLKRTVSARVEKLAAEGLADLRRFSGEERELMRNAFLFEAYHLYFERLDELIIAQEKAGNDPVRVAFAGEVLALLARRGFSTEEARRFLAIFYQVRRAFYFIVQGLIGESDCMKSFRLHLWNNVFTHDIRWYDRYLWNRMEDL